MLFTVGVMGANDDFATKDDLEVAYDVGRQVGRSGAVLLTGGMGGCMGAASRGAKEGGGLVVGVGPTREKHELNEHVDVAVMTGMAGGRNYFNILSADVVIPIGIRSPGTLAEVSFAIQLSKPTLVVGCTSEMRACLDQFQPANLSYADGAEAAFDFIKTKADSYRANR